MNRKVLVVDLDGTLYQCNTFHELLKYLLCLYFKDFKGLKLSLLMVLIKLRLLRIISHAKLKYHVLRLVKNDKIDFEPFIAQLSKFKNEIEEVSNNTFDIKILATAAPCYYAELIAKKNGFDTCLATQLPQNGYSSDFENLREQKKNSLIEYLKSCSLESIDVFITDHIDDASIIKMAKKNIIINPDVKFSNWLNENLVNFETRRMTLNR